MDNIVEALRRSFFSNLTKPLSYRKNQLKQLYNLLDENDQELCDALQKDLRRPRTETMLGEIAMIKQEIYDSIENLDTWAKPEFVKVGIAHKLNKCRIRKEPVGSVLIIGAWNFPILLLLLPFVGAIAAGCTVILKPSEISENCATVITELFPKYLDQNSYRIVNGDVKVTTVLLENRFDHIFYTGNGIVGRIIMGAAAKHLTPVTLELGGKSPAIVANDADAFVKEVPRIVKELYGSDPQNSPDSSRIISQKHFNRLTDLLNKTEGKIVYGGNKDKNDLFFPPTIVSDVPKYDSLMQEELFGPILPIVVVENLDEALEFVRSKDIPLAIYPFSNNEKTIENSRLYVLINDCFMQFSVSTLPFGGQGHSGIGNYRGKRTFDTFSHERSVMTSPLILERLVEVLLELSIPPSNVPVSYTFQLKKGQLLLDMVKNFMVLHDIPCYLEISVMSTIESLMREIGDASKACKTRKELVAKYQKYTINFNDAPVEDIFPKAYHTLVHSPVPSIFDTLLQFEQYCKQAIKELRNTRDGHTRTIEERHKNNIDEVVDNYSESDLAKLIELRLEEVELNQAKWQSKLEEVQIKQKREYCDFVLELFEAHQRWITEQHSTVDLTWIYKLDGKMIVSEVINKMKKSQRAVSKELLRLGQEKAARSRPGSISTMSDIMHSPVLMSPTSPMFANDPEIIKMIQEIAEIGFDNERARMALEMTNRNLEQAVNLLIENQGKVDEQIANAQNNMTRRPSLVTGPTLKDIPSSPHRRTKSHSRPLVLSVLAKQEKKNGWSPMSFLQPKHNMMNSQNNSSVKKISGWIGKAIGNQGNEEVNGHGHLDDSQLVESFTISLGNQVKSTHNLRLLASDMDDLLKSSNDQARDMAYRAQTAANLYSQNLTAIVLLLTPKDWPNYKLGKSANKAFFECCKESTEFHFNSVESQFEAIEKDFQTDGVQEGDFFITKHSNLPLVHVVFHLVIDFESIQKSELLQRSKVIAGLRSILRTVNRFDVTSISLPFLLLPSNVDCFSDPTINENLLYRRGELVLKCTKGFMIENSRLPKRIAEKEQETKTVSFLLPKSATEQQFQGFRLLLTGEFRAS
ncbi:9677_t:CDS:10 [Diversispora eburnea]|uniref:9677_t:CDS:1 n=1 Tax=Diversispora eburnea TaxID=1213867 RepID=A0A9N8W306_9GLOM|nr:9677_t:CDS:10 [Diversispora eburnea]